MPLDPPYGASSLTDDDWVLRTTHVGEGMVEVSLTLCAAARRRQRRTQLIIAIGLAVLLFAWPAPAAAARLALRYAEAALYCAAPALCDRAFAVGFESPPVWAVAAALRLAALAAALTVLPRPVVHETVLAARGLGVQVKAVRQGGGTPYVRFVHAGDLRALVVNEGIQACDVRYYLALVVAGADTLTLLFENSRPRLPAIASAYRSLLPVLFPAETRAAADRYIDRIVAE